MTRQRSRSQSKAACVLCGDHTHSLDEHDSHHFEVAMREIARNEEISKHPTLRRKPSTTVLLYQRPSVSPPPTLAAVTQGEDFSMDV